MRNLLLIVVSMFGALVANAQTKRINFKAPVFYPEGIAFDAPAQNFFISSVKTGTIGKVDQAGNFSTFYQDSSLKSSYGMKVDLKRNKLWVCTGDANYSKYSEPSTYKKLIRLIGIDLKTARKTDDINLSNLTPGDHFANDLTIDDEGNIFITDSYAPVIYKVNTQMQPSVLVTSEMFDAVDVGLNGIVYSDKGYLIVANNSSGMLYKVEIKNPQNITNVKLPTFYPGADGLLWDARGNLVLIQNKGVHKVFNLSSTDNWQSAKPNASTVTEDRFDQPTTGTLRNNELFVLNSKMKDLNDPTAPPAKEFSIQLVRFIPL